MAQFTATGEAVTPPSLITIAIADDHALVRQGIRTLLEHSFQVVGEAADGLEALQIVERFHPDILIVDLMMPHLNGLEVIRQLKQRQRFTKLIALSMHVDEAYVAQAVANGATGYVLKQASSCELIAAVYAVHQGEHYFSAPLCEDDIKRYLQETNNITNDLYQMLTTREREVLQLTAEGNTSHQIAEKLFISARTVEVHRTHLMHKLNLSSKSDLIRYALKQGLIT
jgi:two-component system response regulator NreC